jgi:hypothetical protein
MLPTRTIQNGAPHMVQILGERKQGHPKTTGVALHEILQRQVAETTAFRFGSI